MEWQKGAIDLDLKNVSLAIEELERSARMDSSFKMPCYDLAKAYQMSEKYPRAVDLYKKFIKIKPRNLVQVELLLESERTLESLNKILEGNRR